MPRINIESVRPGMKVKSDARNAEGMLLIPAGCVLSEKHIALLMTWDIPTLEVEAGSTEETVEDPLQRVPPEEIACWQAEIERQFWEFDSGHPVYQELARQMLLRKARASSGQTEHESNHS